ncbi:vascular-related unknown protein 1 isoform X1 [Vitis vinifera]|uniref:Uncharacterized protein n=2 Tax=Vitis vinifera TaxID=29760 RepID=A0A438JHV5_VITVI|nr:vascular-related unknown protein 1 isoform X1 [Vitis vinifera]RVX08531.1 hypothetical protein CK203_014129 [Vitis vinifera]|eukprot:XP_002279953.1 PREDICTED: uncharacterized protein LOC100253364 isoform X1 [Vitis vinifera]
MMEDSLGSFVDKGFALKGAEDGPEESGWTAYFEDLSSISRGHGSNSSACDTSSLVSDAASGAAWKATTGNHVVACSSIAGSPQIPRKLSFKKTRAREISYDDSLEDTASSPVNSPKTSTLQKMEMNPRKTDSHMENSQGKGDGSADHYSKLQANERNEMNDFNGKNNIDCTDLKKRGLCLVPLSMLVSYLG